MIEGLLSVDNAMAIAALASGLPKQQQKLALKLGIIGAYLFRGICLVLAAWIASNLWLKGFGALYLLYLAAEHLLGSEEESGGHKNLKKAGLLATIIQIEVMDLSLSLDNVVAAVALDNRLWVICLGVFIGILALRFVAGACIKLIERFPILKSTAFLLVGFVGALLTFELSCEAFGAHVHVSSLEKFAGIIILTILSIWYGESKTARALLGPAVKLGAVLLHGIRRFASLVFLPVTLVAKGVKHVTRRKTVTA